MVPENKQKEINTCYSSDLAPAGTISRQYGGLVHFFMFAA
jgi:hypothetical protein